MKRFVQCTIKETIPDTSAIDVAWLEENVAQEGYVVRFKGQDSWWSVIERGDKTITEDQLHTLQTNARKGFASTEA